MAIAPALNFSGAAELDPVRVADLFASELASADPNLTILPVSRTVAALARENRRQIESPAHAVRIARRLGVDAVVVLGVTEYRAYPPMIVGLVAQVYGRSPSDFAEPDRFQDGPSLRAVGGQPDLPTAKGPNAQIQQVYNASHDDVTDLVKKYADRRDADKSPYGWRRYMVSQELFLRFCCWASATRWVDQERQRLSMIAGAPDPIEETLP